MLRSRVGSWWRAGALASAALLSGGLSAATAADTFTLRFGDDLPKTHPISVNGSAFWMDQVKKLTNGRVDFQWYPAGQLGKGRDVLALTSAGAIDLGSIGPSYTPDKLPLSAVA